jgi:hypothetical protein
LERVNRGLGAISFSIKNKSKKKAKEET